MQYIYHYRGDGHPKKREQKTHQNIVTVHKESESRNGKKMSFKNQRSLLYLASTQYLRISRIKHHMV